MTPLLPPKIVSWESILYLTNNRCIIAAVTGTIIESSDNASGAIMMSSSKISRSCQMITALRIDFSDIPCALKLVPARDLARQ